MCQLQKVCPSRLAMNGYLARNFERVNSEYKNIGNTWSWCSLTLTDEWSGNAHLSPLERADDFLMFGKPVGFELGKDQFAVHGNVKRSNLSGAYLRLNVELLLNRGRQTGGLW